jgi:hypothetical protein
VGCSTVSPTTSRGLAAEYTAAGKTFVAAPVFARPDGLLKRQATWMVAGEEKGRLIAGKLLESSGAVKTISVHSYFYNITFYDSRLQVIPGIMCLSLSLCAIRLSTMATILGRLMS